MCGIAGIAGTRITVTQREALQRMTDAIVHRGPDGEGHLQFENCALGHRRLAIIDLEGGVQPMCSSDRRVALTFNGEIYGYQDLRRQLAGYPFSTQSDTEVVLALYEARGPACIDQIPGMFAFALWDDRKQELFCARDRFGEKPLYYALGPRGELIFASEIKAIIAAGLVQPVLDTAAVARFLQRQCVEAGQSIYANIHALPPGHTLRYRDGQIRVDRYWSLPPINEDLTVAEAVEQVQALLRRAVQRQLVADVPVGAFLSGGLDSSTVCLVAKQIAGNLRTFSFDFQGEHSEVEYARAVARAYGTEHVELAASVDDIARQFISIQEHYDEPFADSSTIPSYLLAREARRHVKVALTGDAGDELFGGYLWYKPLLWMARTGRIGMLRWVAERILNRACNMIGLPGAAARELRIMGLAYGRQHSSIGAAHRAQLAFFNADQLRQLGLKQDAAEHQQPDPKGVILGSLDDAIRHDIEDYMPANNLTRTDRASMAHGLELRAPFLDVEFASFCVSLPYRLKVSTRDDKIILRKSFADQWPREIRRRSKQGFGAPVVRWLREPSILALEDEFVHAPRAPLYDVVSRDGIRALWPHCDAMQRWTLLVLATWLSGTRRLWRIY